MNKFDYKKEYKDLYFPKKTSSIINIPKMKFIAVDGEGNPNTSEGYKEALNILYGLSFTIKMSKMGSKKINGYFDYVVPPLESLWTTTSPIYNYELIDKNKLIWKAMIRQPDFIDEDVFNWAKEELKRKKPDMDLSKAQFFEYEEGLCVQIMHIGSYDEEPKSFKLLEQFINENNYKKVETKYHHHEIYLTDPRKSKPENNKTVLRYVVKSNK